MPNKVFTSYLPPSFPLPVSSYTCKNYLEHVTVQVHDAFSSNGHHSPVEISEWVVVVYVACEKDDGES